MQLEADVTIGSKVRACRKVWFCDNTFHEKGEVIVVDKDNLAYFRLFTDQVTYEVCNV